jgi:hypothetical protein
MKKIALALLIVVAIAGLSQAQGLKEHAIGGEKSLAMDIHGNIVDMPRIGAPIWDNSARRAWWSGPETGYINLDWGILPDYNGLSDQVIDGFKFYYGTNNMDPIGEDFTIFYFDSTTGYGNIGVQEAGFSFTGLPNGYGSPTLPPGYGWVISVTVDIEGTGYEFLMNEQIGIGMVRDSTPLMGGTGTGNGVAPWLQPMFTGTTNDFDIYYPDGSYNGTWWFGAYPTWATWRHVLYGDQDPGINMYYYGQNSQGNEANLLGSGTWAAGSNMRFMLRKNGNSLPGWLLASTAGQIQYIPQLDVTRLVGNFIGGTPKLMSAAPFGDMDVLDITIPSVAGSMRIYMQGAITQLNPSPPADMSNGVYSN